MNRVVHWNAQLAGLALLCLCLGIAGVFEFLMPGDELLQAPVGPWPAPMSVEAPGEARVLAASDEFAAIAMQTIFRPSRRPPEPIRKEQVAVVTPPSQLQPKPLPQMLLLGIVVSPGARKAIVQRAGAAKTLFVAPGDTIDGWIVKEIRGNRVLFAGGEDQRELTFLTQNKGTATAAAGAQGKPPQR